MSPETYELLKAIYSYDPGYPLNAQTVGELQHDGVRFEKFAFDSFHDGKVPGLLALPEQAAGPVGVVLLLHGVSGNKRQWLGDDFTHGGEVTKALLNRGIGILALDAQYHGERAINNNFVDPAEMAFVRGWGVRYANMLTQSVVDYRRAIDWLVSRDDINADKVGLLGYSMGGHMAFILGAVEKRIRARAACVVPDIPGLPMAAMNFAQDMADAPLLMMMGKNDPNYTLAQANELYEAVPGDAKTLRLYDSGHSLPVEYAETAANWLSEQL